VIIENGGLRQEREASICVDARGLRVYPVEKRTAGRVSRLAFSDEILFESALAKYLSAR
jgi:hypothetical protein